MEGSDDGQKIHDVHDTAPSGTFHISASVVRDELEQLIRAIVRLIPHDRITCRILMRCQPMSPASLMCLSVNSIFPNRVKVVSLVPEFCVIELGVWIESFAHLDGEVKTCHTLVATPAHCSKSSLHFSRSPYTRLSLDELNYGLVVMCSN